MLIESFLQHFGSTQAAHLDILIPTDEFAVAHGASRFLKADKVADLKRKGKAGQGMGRTKHVVANKTTCYDKTHDMIQKMS